MLRVFVVVVAVTSSVYQKISCFVSCTLNVSAPCAWRERKYFRNENPLSCFLRTVKFFFEEEVNGKSIEGDCLVFLVFLVVS